MRHTYIQSICFERKLPIFYTFTIGRKTQMLCRRLCLKRFATKQHIFFRRNKFARRTNLHLFFTNTAAHEKSPTLNHVVCVTHMQTGYESRAWSSVRSRQRIIFIRYFPTYLGIAFENTKNRLFHLLFSLDRAFIRISHQMQNDVSS